MRLTTPIEDKRRAVFRALVESCVGAAPFVGTLTRLYQTTHPSQFARDMEQWQGDITASVNDFAERLARLEAQYDPQLTLSDLAIEVAIWLLGDPDRPPHDPVSLGEITAALPDQRAELVAEAVHELADTDLITITPVVGDGGDRVRAAWPLIWLFQPLANEVSPLKDAARLAEQALTDDYLNAQDIHDTLGWPPPRINAALELIATFAPEGHVSRPAHPVFTLYGIHIDAGTRGRLRRFIGGRAWVVHS
jgi:hypothetical protein